MRIKSAQVFGCIGLAAKVSIGIYLAGCSVAHVQQAPATAEARIPLSALSASQDLASPPDEEIWVIEKPEVGQGDAVATPVGSGTLFNVRGEQLAPAPLEKTDVAAQICGAIASVDVHQRFVNPSQETGEIVYAFPLPRSAAVNEFVMSIGSRHIRGVVRERAEAEQFYREARQQGLQASLMQQRSANLFIHRVANIGAARMIDVEIRYFHTLSYRDGAFEFTFPLVAGITGEKMPLRSGRDLAITVQIAAEAKIERIESSSHAVGVTHSTPTQAMASLEPAEQIPNRDFVLRYTLAGNELRASLFTERNGNGGTYALLMVPPRPTGDARDRRLWLWGMELDWNGANVSNLSPGAVTQLQTGHPIMVCGQFQGAPPGTVTIRGKTDSQPMALTVPAATCSLKGRLPLSSLWARRMIAEMGIHRKAENDPAMEKQVRQLALEYGLMSRYTSFVTIDATGAR